MKLGMQTLYEYNNMIENIRLAKELDMQFIELNLNYEYCRNALEKYETLKKSMEDNGLELIVHFFDEADFGYLDNITKGYIELFKKYAKLAGLCGAKLINVVLSPGSYALMNGRKQYFHEKEGTIFIERLRKNINTLNEICEANNIQLVLENNAVPDFMRAAYRAFHESGYKFTYDIGQDYVNEKRMARVIKHYPLDILCYHIHDANIFTCYLPLGEGEMNLSLAKSLIGDQYGVLLIKDSWDLVKSAKLWKTL